VETVEIGSDRVTVFRQENEATKTATIMLRGATQNVLDDMERAIDDGANVIKTVCKDGRMLAGAGASELELARRLAAWSSKVTGVQQLAVRKYGEAFESIPRALAENSGRDATEVVSNLYAAQARYASDHGSSMACPIGVNVDMEEHAVDTGMLRGVLDVRQNRLYDVHRIKVNALRLATETVLTVLRVDQIIMSKPAGGPKPPKKSGNWDED